MSLSVKIMNVFSRCRPLRKMRSFYTILVLLLSFLIFGTNTLYAQEQSFLSEEEAREEARIAIESIKKGHPDLYWYHSETEFNAYEEKLLNRKGRISVAQHYFDMAYLFSMATDTHTQIYPDNGTPGFTKVYPIRFRTFADGLYVMAASSVYEDYIGKR